METRAPFSFEIIGWHLVGWMDIDIDPDRFETVVTEITINQIDRVALPYSIFQSMDTLPPADRKMVQEFADQYVDENWHEICREYSESMRADRDDD